MLLAAGSCKRQRLGLQLPASWQSADGRRGLWLTSSVARGLRMAFFSVELAVRVCGRRLVLAAALGLQLLQ